MWPAQPPDPCLHRVEFQIQLRKGNRPNRASQGILQRSELYSRERRDRLDRQPIKAMGVSKSLERGWGFLLPTCT